MTRRLAGYLDEEDLCSWGVHRSVVQGDGHSPLMRVHGSVVILRWTTMFASIYGGMIHLVVGEHTKLGITANNAH